MRIVGLHVVTVAALVLALTGCPPPAEGELVLPEGLNLKSLPAAQRALLRVTLEIDESALAETDVVLDPDDLTLSGTFNLQNVKDGTRTATLRVYGRFADESEEVLLGRATDTLEITKGTTSGLEFKDKTFESCDRTLDGSCSLEFDRNRNGASNMQDLEPDEEGGIGFDPGEQAIFIEASPETLQFPSGIRLGQFARQVIVLENRGPNPITFDALDVGGGQGVALSLFDPFGGPVDRPRRSLPVEELTAIVEPGNELLVAVSFAPVNAFLTTAGVQVLARDTVTGVVQATRVKVIANADGTLRPQPDSYVEPDIGASLDVGNGTVPVSAFPAEQLFSGQEITTAGLVHTGTQLQLGEGEDVFAMPADRGFVVDVPAETRLAVSLTGLESDVDLAVLALDDNNAIADVLASSRHPSIGSEGVDVVNRDKERTLRVVVLLGRVELGAAPVLPNALTLDEPAPFQLSCELSRGPEFADERAIEPATGPLEGGTPFVLRGRGFQPGAVVSFADFRALDVSITVDPDTDETLAVGIMPPGSLEVGKNPATAVVENPPIEAGGDGQAATLPEAFLYDPPAARIDVALPDVSPTTGADEPITILGSFFTDKFGTPRVNFGDVALDAVYVDQSTLTVTPPAHDAGTVVMTVQNRIADDVYGAKSNGLAFRFAVPVGPRPAITGLDPATGPADGGDTISVIGSGFVLGSRVLFGTAEAQVLTTQNDAISVITPAVEFDGNVAVTVINPDGQSANRPDSFTYFFPEPSIDGLLPTRVPTTGGTLVIVTGTSLRQGLTAVFKQGTQTIPPLSTVRTSSTSVLVTTPPLPAGAVTIVITNPDGQTATSSEIDVFEPQGVGPSIVFVDPASGPLQGQNLITIAGRDFDPDGVKVVLAGTTFNLPVEVGAAAGFDRVQFVAPPSLTTGAEPIVLENGDGQSTVASYLYVQIDVARIDQVLPRDLTFLPGTEIQVLGEFFSSFSSELQFFLGAGADLQVLPLVARSDGLVIGRVTQRQTRPGFTTISLSDGQNTVSGVINIVVPVIDSTEERGDELEIVGEHLAGERLQTVCAGGDAYRPTLASDDLLIVRRDERNDDRCTGDSASPRPLTFLYDGGDVSFATGATVADETDADGDGVGVRDDADDDEPCVPNLIAAVCDFDGDGLVNADDSAGQDACVPDNNAAPCTRDTDGDGVRDPLDGADADACVPDSNALTCTADADNDGVTNPFDPQDADVCVPNPASAACSRDSDSDGVTDAFDPVDDNSCIPNLTALNCDADRDVVFPPADTNNQDPCIPDAQDPLCENDDDRDGTRNAVDSDDTNACVPNAEALACTADADNDGVTNPFDPRDADPCTPNPASPACNADADVDGVTDAFDPVDNNACIPNVNAIPCDADRDGVFPPADTANEDPCVPDDRDPLCTDDDDRDGLINFADSNPTNPCVPDENALTCTADADGDGVLNPFDPDDVDRCDPNAASPACELPPTTTLTLPSAIHAVVDGDTVTVTGTRLDAVTSATILRVSNNTSTAATIISKSPTAIVVEPDAPLIDSVDANSLYVVRLVAPAGNANSPPFEARKPRILSTLDRQDGVGFVGEFFNPDAIVDAELDDGDGGIVPLTILSASETFLEASFGAPVLPDVGYVLRLTLVDDDGVQVAVIVPAAAGAALRRTAPSIAIGDASVDEGGVAAFVVTLSGRSGVDVSFDVATVTGGASGTAVAGSDFTAVAARRTIPAGQTSLTVTVVTTDDAVDETDSETFTVTLANVANATAGDLAGAGTIRDNDAPPTVSLANAAPVVEGQTATFTVSLNRPSAVDVSFDANTAIGSAGAGDFTAITNSRRTIVAGSTSTTITVTTTDDVADEAAETLTLSLTGFANATGGVTTASGTINDNDAPAVVSVADASVVEGGVAVFVVTLNAPSSLDVSFDATTTFGTASAADITSVAGNRRTIAAGSTSTTIAVATTGDALDEVDETFGLVLSGLDNASAGDVTATGTIGDDDAAPSLALASGGPVTEGSAAQFAIALSGPSGVDVSFDVATSTGGAAGTASAADFTALPTTRRTIPAGALSTTVAIATADDALHEASETFTLSIAAATGASIAQASDVAVITDNDAAPTLSVDDATALEGNALSFVVRLSAASAVPVTFQASTQTGTQTGSASGADFTAVVNAAGTIAAGATSTTVTVTTTEDAVDEDDEALQLSITAIANATGGDTAGAGTIVDDDAAPTLSVAAASATEGAAASFVVTLSAPTARDVAFDFDTSPGTAGNADFTAVAARRTILAGSTSTTIAVATAGDAIDESNETFTVALSGLQNATAGTTTAVGTIVDNDGAPTISIAGGSASEGGVITLTVSLSGQSGLDVGFTVDTAVGSASAADFTAVVASARTIPAGSTSTTITVATANDAVDEDDEAFTVTLSGVSNATAGTTTATATIVDNDAAPVLSIADATVVEGGVASFVVTLSAVSGQAVSFVANTAPGTASAADFTARTNSAGTIAAGSTSTTITVATTNDAVHELDETFTLALSALDNATAGTSSAAGTITDNDNAPTISVAAASATEGAAAGFVVTLSAASAVDVSFDVDTTTGTASAADFNAIANARRTIAAGATTTTINVATVNDAIDEANETFSVALSAIDNATAGTVTAAGTIVDNDGTPTISIAGGSASEGGSVTLTVSLSGQSGLDVGFTVDTVTGTASAADFTAIAASPRTIPAGSTSTTITVATVNDAVDEDDEAFTVTLSGLSNATAGTTTATASIVDNDATPVLSIADATVVEGGVASFVVTLSAASGQAVSFVANTATGTASAADFTALVNSAGTIAAGATSTTITVATTNDTIHELSETFTLTLSAIDNATAGTSSAVGTITDNDNAPTLSVAAASATEGAAAGFVVTLSAASAVDVSFDVDTTTGTASAADFNAIAAARRTIAAGSTTTTINVATVNDAIDENSETFSLSLSSIENATAGTITATGTIVDNDAAPSLSIGPATTSEGGNAVFTVTLSAPTGLDVTFDVDTAAGSAIGADFTAITASTVAILAGSTSTTVSVITTNDAVDEADESFTVTLSGLDNATAGTLTATGTIVDNDAAPVLSIANAAVTEGGIATFVVSLNAPSGQAVTFSATTANGSAGAADFTAVNGAPGAIAAGATSTTVTVATTNDGLNEATETFTVSLSSVVNATAGASTATGTITDNDAPPTLNIAGTTVAEGANAVFTVTLSAPSSQDVSFDVDTAAGTASSSDFAAIVGGRRTISAGSTSTSIAIPTTDDAADEANEAFTVSLSALSNASAGATTATGTITDNDAPPSLFVADASGFEGGSVSFVVTLSAASGLPVSFDIATSNGTATAGDFVSVVGPRQTIAAGTSSLTVTVGATNDGVEEPAETFTLRLSNLANASAGRAIATGTISDPPPGFGISNFNATGCLAVEHAAVTGDDRGGIAVTSQSVYYAGDSQLGRFRVTDLVVEGTGPIQDAIVSDFETETILSLFNQGLNRGPTAFEAAGFPVTHIATLDAAGQPNGIRVALSQTINLGGQNGYFSGFGKLGIFVRDTNTWFIIDLNSGLVTSLGVHPAMNFAFTCESNAFRGVLEERAPNAFSFLFAQNPRIIRLELPSRRVSVVTQFSSLSDMCSFTILPSLERWYWHHEGTSQFRSGDEAIGFCDVQLCGDSVCSGAALGENAVSCSTDCSPTCGNGVCESPENNASCPGDCAATCGNNVCDEVAAGCPSDCTGVVGGCGDGYCSQGERVSCAADCP